MAYKYGRQYCRVPEMSMLLAHIESVRVGESSQ